MQRNTDVTGVSGTGRVVEGVILDDSRFVMTWLGDNPSCVIHQNLESAIKVHGHEGSSIFISSPEEEEYPKRYVLNHTKDMYGLTKVGQVADIVEFSNGYAIVYWRVYPYSLETWSSMDNLKKVHCSQDYTEFKPLNN